MISHRVFAAAAGNGVVAAKGRSRSKPGLIDLKNGSRSAGSATVVGPDPDLRSARSVAGGN